MKLNQYKPSSKELFYVPFTPDSHEVDVSTLRKLEKKEVDALLGKVTTKRKTMPKKVAKSKKNI
ncbi:MAG: hypothetical protein LC105_05315 [Chitinophagales bacterium]|nr:hypothetical protein [Chitinophagales bacterium]MCZ2393253.1 hypothetical protein [Chitinophagales bacterium]